MNTVFWHQSRNVSDSDVLIIDDHKTFYSGKEQENAALDHINKMLRQKPLYTDGNVSIFSDYKDFILIKSHLRDLDELGRLIPYLFLAKTNDIINKLRDYSLQYGYNIRNEDYDALHKGIYVFRKCRIGKYIILLVIIVLIIWMIIKLMLK